MDQKDLQQFIEGQSLLGSLKLIFNYLINDVQKRPRSFKIGIFTIFLVIGFTAAIQSIFQISPVIFLQIAENNTGDADIIITPNTDISYDNMIQEIALKLLNQTEIDIACQKVDKIEGCAPRWMVTGDLMHPDTFEQNEEQGSGDIINKYKSYVIGYDSKKERSIGLGRRLDVEPLQQNQAYVTGSTARGLGLKPGQQVLLNMDLVNDFLLSPQFLGLGDEDSQTDLEEEFSNAIVTFIEDIFNVPEFDISTQEIRDAADLLYETAITFEDDGEFVQIVLEGILAGFGFELDEDLFNDVNITQVAEQAQEFAYELEGDDFTIQQVGDTLSPIVIDALNFTANFDIREIIDGPEGKFADILGHTILLDIHTLYDSIIDSIRDTLDEELYDVPSDEQDPVLGLLAAFFPKSTVDDNIDDLKESININEYAIVSNIVLKDRMEIYVNQGAIDKNIQQISDDFYENLGKDHPSLATTPLALQVAGLLLIKLFLDNIIVCSVFLLSVLSILLIYSLMISDVEEKTYEFGMIRALGLKKISLIHLILIEGLLFAIPGLSLGLIFAYLINGAVGYMIFSGAQIMTTYGLHYTSLIIALCLGFLIPIISNYIPIKRALNKTLRDSLDLYHRTTNEVAIHVIKLEKMGISFPQFVCAITLISMGLVSYYFAPYAFINNDIALFLFIINFILILMIIGITLIANLLQSTVEKILIKTFLLFNPRDKKFEKVILKNMEGHRSRNEKTTLMYTVAISFLIFVGTAFNLQTITIGDMLASFIACDIKVMVPEDYVLDEMGLRQYMEDYQLKHPDHIKGYTFVTKDLTTLPQVPQLEISPLSGFPLHEQQIYGIERNYLESVTLDFYIPTETDDEVEYGDLSNGQVDLVGGLYNNENLEFINGQADAKGIISNGAYSDIQMSYFENLKEKEIALLLSSGLAEISSMSVDTPILLTFGEYISFRGVNRGMAQKFPGFLFSGYRNIAFYGDVIVSMKQYSYLQEEIFGHILEAAPTQEIFNEGPKYQEVIEYKSTIPDGSTFGVAKESLLIKFQKELSQEERERLINGLRHYFNTDDTIIFDVPNILDSMNSSLFYIILYSIVVSVIAMILSFFLILVSFISNIKEASWEFGVLRAIGLNKSEITRIYIYEALSLVVGAGIIGTTVGIVIAVTITLQFLMFVELPFTFIFPWNMFLSTFVMGIVVSVLGSYFALREFRDKPISSIIKGLI